jgi:hypothetical protein
VPPQGRAGLLIAFFCGAPPPILYFCGTRRALIGLGMAFAHGVAVYGIGAVLMHGALLLEVDRR